MRDERHGGIFFEHAGRFTLAVAVDRSGGRVQGGSSDSCELHGSGVGDTVMAGGVHQPDGVIWRDGVEVRSSRITAFGQLALVPTRTGDPIARPAGQYFGFDARGIDIGYWSHAAEIDQALSQGAFASQP